MRPLLLLVPTLFLTSYAAAQNCGFAGSLQKDLNRELQSKNITEVRIDSKSGDLRVNGGTTRSIAIQGLACTNNKALLNQIKFTTRVLGNVLYIDAQVPRVSLFQQAALHLNIDVPSSMKVSIRDDSGDIFVQKVSNLKIQDDSGDMDLSDIAGTVRIEEDGSGDMAIRNVKKEVKIDRDDSGDILIEQVSGPVTIGRDGSGDIIIRNAGSTTITSDDSGEIQIEHIQGNVLIREDDSGDIGAHDISGNFTVGQDGSGDINFDQVKGQVQLPRKR
ncbi:DUF4097 family beta strand repeat-containing protein [Deinococcus cellulosilyticus]|uniref:DUF4097 domain-containing protein n=1 Tax=Deinococcus cellulosilyticus (strain DSM 18568 / NBRC 106333 / KACC 11606 / 5516J-15) TaxID=1223518 RepID=A0A511N7V7_DEIC1|nr:DUF4097 family beta strand repeat-containing protein [Deinococcus cellulosilyticus]GEM48501.1 hypothetical protein DC3_41360 [Deinococcus cellulosilyticus NBRC 106333 = KACC 11606]